VKILSKIRPEGVIVPLLTPFNKNEKIDKKSLINLIDYLLNSKVDGLFILGSSGEFNLLSEKERSDFIRLVVDQVNGRLPVYAAVSDPGTENAIRYAQTAKDVGADAIVATTPYYYKTSQEGIIDHYKNIIYRSEMPLMIYHIPTWTYQDISLETANKLADEDLIVALKYTTSNMNAFQNYVRLLGNRISMLIGQDPLFYTALELGADGGVLGSANVAPSQYVEIYKKYKEGRKEASKKIQNSVFPLTDIMGLGYYPAALKEAMKLIGRPVGPVRKPLVRVSNLQIQQIAKALKQMNMLKK